MRRLDRIRLDYKPLARAARQQPRRLWLALAALPVAAIAALGMGGGGQDRGGIQALAVQRLELELPQPVVPPPAGSEQASGPELRSLKVRPGDTLAGLFAQHGLSRADLHAIMQLAPARRLTRLMPGDEIRVAANADGEILSLRTAIDKFSELRITRAAEGFAAQIAELPVQHQVKVAHGKIASSLFEAGLNAGLSDTVIMNMAHIFSWDIDFVQDLRPGDSFTVIYEELYRDGEKLADGPILAAEFVNQGRAFRAVRYTSPAGETNYYTPDGKNMRKALLRNVVDFTRISSNFSNGRRHPILNRVRRHQGTDYAAPAGTPIKAAGGGRIVFRGVKGGYGNVIIIEHGSGYSTLYAHMRGFARGLRTGSRVKQGQVIGYVGMSGLATGPHLHYEVRLNGVHRDPRRVELPDAAPVDPLYRAEFLAETRPLLRQLDLISPQPAMLAAANK